MMTVLEKEFMQRTPNEIRRLRESIDRLVEVLQPISEAIKNKPEISADQLTPQTILFGLSCSVGEENPKT